MEWLLIRLRRSHLYRVITLLRNSETQEHDEARTADSSRSATEHRAQAEEDANIRRTLTPQYYGEAVVHDESVSNNSAPVQQVKMSAPSGRDLLIGTVMALSILINVALGAMYLNAQRTVADAYKDIKTQVWVRQDKDEERFEKFVAGPYAKLAGDVEASHILFSKCEEKRR